MNKYILFLAAFLLFHSASSSVKDSIGVVKINDKLHVRYFVSPGETIYGISTRFGVSVSELLEINPELENGLKVGQVINIPYNPELVKNKKENENVVYHKVESGETLFGLSKKYNVALNDLLKWNGMELKAGQEIVVGYKDQEKKEAKEGENKAENKEAVPVTVAKEEKINETPASSVGNIYPYDPSRKQILIIPFDPYLYFSDADDEIAAKSNVQRTRVREIFRRRLSALLDKPGYEMIYLLGGKAKDSLSDLNKIYSSVSYQYQSAINNPNYVPASVQNAQVKKDKSWLDKQKEKLKDPSETKYDVPKDHGNYFGVKIRNPEEFFAYFNTKYSVDYYVFINQFEVKTNYENCLDRASLNFERSFTTHFSIFDANGKQIAGNKFKTHYNSNSNYIYQIVADNVPAIADRILRELPPHEKPTE